MAELKLTKANFHSEVICSDKPVLVDFYADWCAPCKMLSPVISEIAQEYKDTVKVGKVNVDEEGELAALYNISSIPAVILFENGKVKNTSLGFVPKEKLEAML